MFDLDEKFTEMKEDELQSVDGGSVSVVCEQTKTITEEEYKRHQVELLKKKNYFISGLVKKALIKFGLI